QQADRLADGHERDAEALREQALRRQGRSGGIPAGIDLPPQRLPDPQVLRPPRHATPSIARRSSATDSRTAACDAPSSRSRIREDATTTPSATAATAAAWLGDEMPKPASTGRSVHDFTRRAVGS